MSELMYVNAAKSFKNPKTGEIEDVRAKETARLKALKEQGFTIIGLEMTEPELAALCDRNIDPQHTDKREDQSCAKEIAEHAPAQLGWFKAKDLDKVVFVTNRVDVDSVAAFVLADRYLKGEKISYNDNVEAINTHDTAAGNVWQKPEGKTDEDRLQKAFDPESKTKALAASIQVFKVTPDNIKNVADFIDTGMVDDDIMASFRASQQAIIAKVKTKEIKVESLEGSGYVTVTSTERAATDVGYAFTPVVIAENPAMRAPDGHTYHKVSICQHAEGGYIDLTPVSIALNKIEIDEKIKAGILEKDCVEAQVAKCKEGNPRLNDIKALEKACSMLGGWGGSPTFLGSPAGCNCVADMSTIKKLVYANLTPEYKAKVTTNTGMAGSGKNLGD